MDDDQYGLPDLRQLISRSSHLSPISHPLEPYGSRTNPTHFDSIHVVPHHQYTPPPPATHTSFAAAASSNPGTSLCAMDMDCGIIDSGNTRWPRQETLTLLEIRSQLDSKFKEANHKGPLWDEVSRIMSEEHGYQRSGKKCREKFENLYKYYKKTKEGKAGRQDGKNYRFFRQLEAIYGETAASVSTHYHPQEAANNSLQDQAKLCESLSFSISNSSHEFETSSSENNNDEYDLSAVAFMMSQSRDKKKQHLDDDESPINKGCKRSRRLRWREKVKSFVDSQMKKLMERQEAWMDNMLKTIELKEQERVWREMEWKKQETARFDREHELWAKERAWIEARDATLMEALKKFTGQDLINANRSLTKAQMGARYHQVDEPNMNMVETANESEILSLIQLRTGLESSFQDCGYSSDSLWEVIATKMACLGHNLSASECKEKWENIRSSFIKITECSRKE